MTAHTYAIFQVPLRKEFARIVTEPSGMRKYWLLAQGAPYSALFPAGAAAELDADYKGTKLADFVWNAMDWLIVSERARDVLAREPVLFEIFPLGVLDQKRRPVQKPYYLAHPLGTVDCVDLQRSEFVMDSYEKHLVHTFNRLVLDPARIPPEPTLFRIKEQPRTKIIRSDLVDRLRAAGVDGFELWSLDTPIVL